MNPTRRQALSCVLGAGFLATSANTPYALLRHERSGHAFGTTARLIVLHEYQQSATAALDAGFAELRRVERIFSLFDATSELSRLNLEGHLAAPSDDLRTLFKLALKVCEASGGAFDPTIQPVWTLRKACAPQRPAEEAMQHALTKVGIERVAFGKEIRLQQGQAMTFNGIAQGYAADCVRDVLVAHGIADALIDTGEMSALGGRNGEPWRALLEPNAQNIPLTGALAVSSGERCYFSSPADHHILDPSTGYAPTHCRWACVQAQSAAVADSVSTAVMLLPGSARNDLVAAFPDLRIVAG